MTAKYRIIVSRAASWTSAFVRLRRDKSTRPRLRRGEQGDRISAFRLPSSVICLLFGVLLTFLAITISVRAQSYSVDGLTVAGGGGTSSNGQYSVSGIPQCGTSTGPMSGGTYSLTGGFRAIFVLQTSGAPVLTVTLDSPHAVVVSWSLSATNFVLMQNSSLTTTNWIPSSYPLTTNGGVVGVTITSAPAGNLFFRLKD